MPSGSQITNVPLSDGVVFMSIAQFEQEIVIAFGVKRRIEINEINGFGREMVAEDVKIIPEEKLIHPTRD